MARDRATTRVLLVDDDDAFRRIMSTELVRRGYEVDCACDGESALDHCPHVDPDVVLLDLCLPDIDGIEVLKRLSAMDRARGVVVLTGHGTIDTAVQAVRLGAYDYLEKPCPVDEIEISVQKAHEHRRLLERQKVLEDGYCPPDVQPEFIGTSPAFKRLKKIIAKIASTDATTLILGETGVGKEMVATLLHAQSPRCDRPFVVVDCAALRENLLQNELFGHEKGAFTDASRQKHGLFEVANGGTLFLDEVGDTSPEVQSQLLRVLETGSFRRLGGTTELRVDVRVVSATNRDLSQAISRGHFRKDLFFRLATLTIEIPPLRERPEDVPLLVEHFTRLFNKRFSRSTRFSREAMDELTRCRWPGNVRELIHSVEQAVLLAEGASIEPHDLPAFLRAGEVQAPAQERERSPKLLPLKDVERRHVLAVLEEFGGNRAQTARALQISKRNLYRLLDRYGVSKRSSGSDASSRSR